MSCCTPAPNAPLPLNKLQLGTATFLRPAEKRVSGSVTAFKALLDAMLAQGKMGVCRCVMRNL